MQRDLGRLGVVQERAFRNLEMQACGGEAGLGKYANDVGAEALGGEALAYELLGSDVDVHAHASPSKMEPLPGAGLATGFGEDPGAQRHDESRLFGEGDEVGRRDEAALRLLPAPVRHYAEIHELAH